MNPTTRLCLTLLLCGSAACATAPKQRLAQARARDSNPRAPLADDLTEAECDGEPPTGSHIPRDRCWTAEELDQQRTATQKAVDHLTHPN